MDLKDLQKRDRFKACASDADVLKTIDSLESENNAFRTAETAREAAAVTALLDAAEKDGRINATTRPTFEALLKADRTNGENALKGLAPKRNAMNDIDNDGGTPAPVGSWAKRQQEIANKLKK